MTGDEIVFLPRPVGQAPGLVRLMAQQKTGNRIRRLFVFLIPRDLMQVDQRHPADRVIHKKQFAAFPDPAVIVLFRQSCICLASSEFLWRL